ncbi:hydroxyacylglutathione hydrolase [Synechococcus moorigangaii CMS01]|nr:hydroxyacylglutathione hydrolase [Synechococcus moorigangaii CMS01]
MEIVRLPAFNDNYIFVLVNPATRECVVVDPGDRLVVLDYLHQENLTLTAILITHHHADHVGGNRQLLGHFPTAAVYGSAVDLEKGRIPGQTVGLGAGDRLTIFDHTAEILFVPGHTQGHIAYYFPPIAAGQAGDLFCGDTLFANGCGRLLEGTPDQLFASLQQICTLPDDTKIWCAHEYTLKNIQFSLTVNPENEALQARLRRVQTQRQQQEPTIPTVLGLEKQTNPFLRCGDRQLQANLKTTDALRTFIKLRGKRDLF